MNIFQFAVETSNSESCYNMALNLGLLSETPRNCPICDWPMKLERGKTRHSINKRFRCFKRTCRHQSSFLKNTIFNGTHLNMCDVLRLMYCFSINFGFKKTIKHLSLSPKTVNIWFKIFRKIIYVEVMKHNEGKIGGKGLTVEIDETHICKRKYGVGRVLLSEAVWLVGGICRETSEIFLKVTKKRSSEVLKSLILQNVEPGSRIITDCWKGYGGLSTLDYEHLTINHSVNFINPENREIHTQNVERLWRSVKAVIKKKSRLSQRDSHLTKFLWDRRNNIDELDAFRFFANIVAIYYNNLP